jgi:DNA-binding beta-propeller fold protein YncE
MQLDLENKSHFTLKITSNMKKTINQSTFLMAAALLFWQCGPQQNTGETTNDTIAETNVQGTVAMAELLWETPAELTTCESVYYDQESGNIYVANIEGDASEKDGKGSISIISKDGEITQRDWVTGLNAPKGMGISDGKLFVTDIDEVVEIDIASAKVTQKHPVKGSQFLNDLDTHDGIVYFTDMRAGTIHTLEEGSISTFAEGQSSINGIRIADNGTLYGLDGTGLKKYDSDGNFEIINDAVTGGDGLVIIDDNTFIASRWGGEVFLVQDGIETLIIDTKAEESNTADIDFIPEDNIILVPTFLKNKVTAYQLSY